MCGMKSRDNFKNNSPSCFETECPDCINRGRFTTYDHCKECVKINGKYTEYLKEEM